MVSYTMQIAYDSTDMLTYYTTFKNDGSHTWALEIMVKAFVNKADPVQSVS